MKNVWYWYNKESAEPEITYVVNEMTSEVQEEFKALREAGYTDYPTVKSTEPQLVIGEKLNDEAFVIEPSKEPAPVQQKAEKPKKQVRISEVTGKRLPKLSTLENRLARLKATTSKRIEVLLRQMREHHKK